jgi:hypothetical protein
MRCTFVTIVLLLAFAPSPASAHGENDARAIAKDVTVGPYEISVWQVIGDHDSAVSSHVVVDFGTTGVAPGETLLVAVESARRSSLVASQANRTDGMWQTAGAVGFGDVIRIRISDDAGEWRSQSLTVPQPPRQTLVVKAMFALTIFFSTVAALWLGQRARRVWSRPLISPSA